MKNKTQHRGGGNVTVWIKKEGPFDPRNDQVLVGSQDFTGRDQPRSGGRLQIDKLSRALTVCEHRSQGRVTTGVLLEATDDEFARLSGNGWAVGTLPPVSAQPRPVPRSMGYWDD